MNDSLPSDPFMLLSTINMKLRNDFPSLDELCASLGLDRPTLERQLATVGCEYNEELNKFW